MHTPLELCENYGCTEEIRKVRSVIMPTHPKFLHYLHRHPVLGRKVENWVTPTYTKRSI